MPDKAYEFTGKTVDEAVAEGLSQLNVVRSDVAVEVLSKGSRGIFGIGSEPARVRIMLETGGRPTDEAPSVTPSSVEQQV
ncbi:MAG: Jag N-terminal domain-containing protein, partial [Candidatus Promineifilaceae bacterium]